MRKPIRLFVLFGGIAFMAASLSHFGILLHGYEHLWAGRAEGVISVVLLIGFLLSWILPSWTRGIGIAVQTFALIGTCVGIYTIAIGVGPRTIPDITFHIAIVVGLIAGLIVTFRAHEQVGSSALPPPP